MKKSLLILAIIAIMATPALAQDPHDAGVFFDAAGTLTSACWPSFTQTNNFWAIGFDLDGQVKGYEFGVTIDPTIIIFNSAMDQNTGPINVGQAPANWIVGTGACLEGSGAFSMVVWTAGYFVSPVADLLICMGPSSPSSFNPATPGYLQCDGSLVPFGVAENGSPDYPNGCGVICPTGQPPVGADETTWGAVKTAY